MSIAIKVERVGLTLDLLLFRAYGRPGNSSEMLGRAQALNPGVSALGAVLPLGTSVLLPDLDRSTAPAARKAVNLFGDS